VTRPGPRGAWLAVVFTCLLAAPVSAQQTVPPTEQPVPPTQQTVPPGIPPSPLLQLPPGTPLLPFSPPVVGLARRGPITITPTLAVTGEYNDNIFQNNANKESDFILGFSPGITIAVESPIYRLIGSYSFTAEIYADHEELNDAFSRHNLRLDASYRATPQLTLLLSETLIVSNDTNLIAAENVSTGRTRSTSNTLSPGVEYQLDPRTLLRFRGAWTALRFDSDDVFDSDTYAAEGFVDYAFTPRLTGSAGYQFSYFDVDRQPYVITHTPRVGVRYRFTPTLTGAVSGGPTIQVPEEGETDIFPAITASLQQRFPWGSAAVQYDHAVGTSGGLGGTTENQSLGAIVQLDRLMRGLLVQFVPRYTRSTSTVGDEIDVHSFSLTLQGRYEINRYIAAIAGYTHFLQRSSSAVGGAVAGEVDQNRVFVGLQFGYPITID
jgi:hypothetical protein